MNYFFFTLLLISLYCRSISYAQITFAYDAAGNRVAKQQAGNNGGQPCPNTKANGRMAAPKMEEIPGVILTPNPSTGRALVYFQLTQQEAATLIVTNSLGVEIHRRKVTGLGTSQSEELDLTNSSPGIYIVRLKRASEVVSSSRLLITR